MTESLKQQLRLREKVSNNLLEPFLLAASIRIRGRNSGTIQLLPLGKQARRLFYFEKYLLYSRAVRAHLTFVEPSLRELGRSI
jgi:hypothetical protein